MRNDEALLANALAHIQEHINMLQDPIIQNLHMLLGHQGLPAPAMGGIDPTAMGPTDTVGVAPGAAPANLPNPAQPPAGAQPR
jgi:hypothetical protein